MSIIARTAGIGRTAPELQWDLNYLLKLWNGDRRRGQERQGRLPDLPGIEPGDPRHPRLLQRRHRRDPDRHRRHLRAGAAVHGCTSCPSTRHRVKRYRDDAPLFSRFQIEHQIETAFSRTVHLPSGGAIVIDHTEALVAIDVNSARATKGGDIEETATRTNLEAADEMARQARLRDLGGLIVDRLHRHGGVEEPPRGREPPARRAAPRPRPRAVRRRSAKFGLLEMSRQRLRPALSEGSHITCPRCNGTGHIRDTESLGAADPAHHPGGVDEGQHRRRARASAGRGRELPAQREAHRDHQDRAQAARHRAAGAQQAPRHAELQAGAPAPRRPAPGAPQGQLHR